ncbi:DNA translocase FtsK [Paractinoplanes atraurantiacus]|uniref:Ftsk gamma domain-containing protein n=1 Tax=Paractinoplanes atraurantiacus TaxID=1036182 RepID=A0A285KM26_9ACTN|nr:DNA translocase FtsK [Actinoplanes atraurantiacus]SNY72937.1 Ftsk gamma domain-containing protein [Actinoplanes atraurantiacus]
MTSTDTTQRPAGAGLPPAPPRPQPVPAAQRPLPPAPGIKSKGQKEAAGPADAGQVPRSRRMRAARHQVAAMPLAGHTAPWPVTLLLWAGAAAAHHGPHGVAMTVAVVAPVAAIVWWWQYERGRSRRMRRKHRRHAAIVTGLALLWLAWAAHAGAGGTHALVLWFGMVAAVWPYWRRRTVPIPASVGALAAVPTEADPTPHADVDDRLPEVVKWDSRVAIPGGAGPGSYLTDMQQVPGGRTYTIQLAAGRQTTMQIRAAQAMLCSALNLAMDELIVDAHPSGALSQAVLTLVEGRPLAQVFPHPGPDKVFNPATGYAAVGMHPDEQPAEWALFVPGWGLAGGVIVGGIGSGKSTLMKNIATTAKHTGVLSVWAGCPVGGQSFPALLKNAEWSAYDVAGIMPQLRGLARLIEVRGALNNVLGRELHVPTAAEPGVLLFLDEFHKITRKDNPDWKEAVALLERIAQEGRKAAVAVVASDQTVNIQKTFGNSDVMRSNLWFKNLAVLRVASDVENGMIPGLDGVNPADLPERFNDGSPTSGLGYLRGLRVAPFRGWLTPNADELLAAAPNVELDTVSARTIGEAYLNRHELRAQAQVDQARTLLDLDPELLTAITAANPQLAAAIEAHKDRPRRPAEPAAGQPSRVTGGGTVLQLTGQISPAPSLRLPDPAPAETDENGPQQRVLALLRSGITETGELRKAYGCGETRMRDLLNALAAAGKARSPKKGYWVPADAPAAADGEQETLLSADRELLAHAAELVVSSQFGSTAMLQRKLRARFAEATALMDDLHTLGAVGPFTGDGRPRDVLAGPGELPALLTRIRGGRQAA